MRERKDSTHRVTWSASSSLVMDFLYLVTLATFLNAPVILIGENYPDMLTRFGHLTNRHFLLLVSAFLPVLLDLMSSRTIVNHRLVQVLESKS